MIPKNKSTAGLTLPELMVVLVIIGVLAAMMGDRLLGFIADARRAEAKNILQQIHMLQTNYQLKYDSFKTIAKADSYGYRTAGSASVCARTNDIKALGLKIDNCEDLRYQYWVGVADGSGSDTQERFIAWAHAHSDNTNRIYPACDGDRAAFEINHPNRNTLTSGGITNGDLIAVTEDKRFWEPKDTTDGVIMGEDDEADTIIFACQD